MMQHGTRAAFLAEDCTSWHVAPRAAASADAVARSFFVFDLAWAGAFFCGRGLFDRVSVLWWLVGVEERSTAAALFAAALSRVRRDVPPLPRGLLMTKQQQAGSKKRTLSIM